MTINLADNSPRISYAVAQGATQTSFAVPFEFFASADLNVYVDGTLKTLTTHYTVSGGDGSTGTVTISVTGATGGSTVVITRDVALERTTDFPSSGPFQIGALNTELDRLTAIAADLDDKAGRALQLTDFDVAASLVLPTVDNRKGKTLAFNASSGAVEAGPTISDVQTVSAAAADIQTLAHIEDGTDATDAIQTVAGIASNVSTVAGVSSAVSTVAGISSNVTAVAADATDIGVVAGKAAEIGRLGTAQAVADLDILATTDAVSDMNTLAAISANISTVASISANVTSVAGVSSLITSDFVADLNTLATTDIVSDLNTLATADIVSDLNTLATSDIVSDLNTLATADIVSDLNTLATSDIVSDLNTLATTDIVTDLNLLATSAIVEDLNLLATSTVIADMATLAGAGANPNISSLGVSGNITFADNGKAIFGAGSDLQIYHDGSSGHSIITESGSGALQIQGENLVLEKPDGTNYLLAVSGASGYVKLYQNGSEKLATTSTGIQVTGNISNASGDLTLDVAGDINLDAGGQQIFFQKGGTTFGQFGTESTPTNFTIESTVSDGDIVFKGNDGGSTITSLTLDMSEAGAATFNVGGVFNESGADSDFRVESDSNTHMLFVDAGADHVNIGSSTDRGGLLNVDGTTKGIVVRTTNSAAMELIHADNGAGVGPYLYLNRPSSGPAADDQLGRIVIQGKNSADEVIDYVRLVNQLLDPTNGSEQGRFAINTMTSGTQNSRLNIVNGESVFNDESVNVDFRVESNNNSGMLVVDAADDQVRMGNASASTPSSVASLVARTGVTTDYSGSLTMSYQAGTYTDYYKGMTGINPSTSGARGLHIFNHDNDSDGGISFWSGRPTVGTPVLMAQFGPNNVIFNDNSADRDFRVESNNNVNALFLDAGSDRVCIGNNDGNVQGFSFQNLHVASNYAWFGHNASNTNEPILYINRQNNDGSLVKFYQATSEEGSISVSGSTVSFNGFSGRHESSGIPTNTAKGTVVSTIDALDVYPNTQLDPKTGEPQANPKAGQTRADHAKVEISSSEGDTCVYGVVSEFDSNGKVIVTSVGIGSVRVTGACSKGDLLESNGDGTAKVQSDDIVRSKTLGKVTIGNSDTGVKLVSCVMYCG